MELRSAVNFFFFLPITMGEDCTQNFYIWTRGSILVTLPTTPYVPPGYLEMNAYAL